MTKTKSVKKLFERAGLHKNPNVDFNKNMYTIKANPEENWLLYSLVGFQNLKNILANQPQSFGVVGTGNGIDALGILLIFDSVSDICITDLDGRVIEMSKENVRKNIQRKINIYSGIGNLTDPLPNRVDVIYGNLPNIPSDEDLTQGIKQSSFYRNFGYTIPAVFKDYLLALQYLFLENAKNKLNKEGYVVSAIGGRVPFDLLQKIFTQNGYELLELANGFKLQTEPWEIIPSYAAYEKNGIEFDFYIFNKARDIIRDKKIENPNTKISGDELKYELKSSRIKAGEALSLYKKGIPVGHTVHILGGKCKW